MTPLPWQRELWSRLQSRRAADTFPHALLLAGVRGLGKQTFARALVLAMSCDQPAADGTACGSCEGCKLVLASSHPDVREVAVAEDASEIKVAQVRELVDFVQRTRIYDHYKIVLIIDAELMNRSTANALLKTLEEPAGRSLIILTTAHADWLPATVRSRCQRLQFVPPPQDEAVRWLAQQLGERNLADQNPELLLSMAQGRPLAALEIARTGGTDLRQSIFDGISDLRAARVTPTSLAQQWAELPFESISTWLLSWLRDMVRMSFGATLAQVENPDFWEHLQGLAKQLDLEPLFFLIDDTQRAWRKSGGSLNEQLLLEGLLVTWVEQLGEINRAR